MIFKYILACTVLLMYNNICYCQQVKKVICGNIINNDTIISCVKEYSPEGYLLSEDEPEIYCGTTYTYDESGRIKERFFCCGETMSNGTTSYNYLKNKTCIDEYAAGYTHILCDSFDTERNLIRRLDTYIDYMQDENITVVLTQYFYQQKRLTRKEERKIEYNKDSSHIDTTFLVSSYEYNSADSLTGYFKINQKMNDTIEKLILQYDCLTHRKIKEVKYTDPIYSKEYSITYRYDQQGRLIEKNYTGHSQNKIVYIFKKDQLVTIEETLINAYDAWEKVDNYNNNLLTKTVTHTKGRSLTDKNYYNKDLLIKTVTYEKGKAIGTLNYYYTFW